MSQSPSQSPSHGLLLLVDDDPAVRRTLGKILERAGFTVLGAASMAEAYERIEDATPAFAVVDLNLSDGYGMELVSGLIDACPGIRVVVLTGYDSIASAVVAIKAGAWGYLAKPVDADQLVATLLGDGPMPVDAVERPMSADRIRWEYIQRVFEQCGRNVSETARRLNMHRRTLQRILSKRAPRP
jgi:two-component system response regulator RegA